jgi:type IX secretion system PorP/SprF family membrane protein
MNLHMLIFKRLNVLIFVVAFTFSFHHKSVAQDIHFSQQQSVPLSVNPSVTGVLESDIRLTNDYRNQWHKIDYPFHTLYLAIDGKIRSFGRLWGLGAMLIHDQSSSLYFTSEKLYFSVSHSFFYRNNQFVIGIQPGIVLKYYNSNNITFGSQFDSDAETFNPALPSNEDLLNDRINYFELNAGGIWRARIQKLFITSGISLAHINRPVESFFHDNDSVRVPLRFTFHGDVVFPVTEKIDLTPMLLFSTMKGANEFVGSIATAYYPRRSDLLVKKVYAISGFRINPVRTIDALILGGGTRVGSLDLCITYDINVSSLRNASNYQGAFEISLMLNINKRRSTESTEPCIML